jgi:6-phosphogluconate dehydrogenase
MSNKYQVGVIGLGRMGLPLCENLQEKGYPVCGFDLLEPNRAHCCSLGMTATASLADLCALLPSPRRIILMVTAGEPTGAVITALMEHLAVGDIIIDAGNSHYLDSINRAALLDRHGIGFLDVGTSGGTSGARHGACLTIGGKRELFEQLGPLFRDIACPGGCLYVGPSGWGHLVKTIHNGIEYGFLQAIAEGLHTISKVAEQQGDEIDLAALCRVWGNGSIIASRLIGDTVQALEYLRNHQVSGQIGGGETGRWAEQIARDHGVAAPALTAALAQRERSRQHPDFSGEIIAAIRNVFGQHEVI